MSADGVSVEQLRVFRRDLHQIPETAFDLPETIAYVRNVLEGLDPRPEILTPSRSCVCAYFNQGAKETVAVRADMDALPVTERTGVGFASRHEGRMHACGHDGHMAMALGLATSLAGVEESLPRNVLVVFQPAEETGGGAKLVCESGIFERLNVTRIFGFHLWPEIPIGAVASRPGPMLAGSNEIDVTFMGRASHIAKPDEGSDAVLAACRFLSGAYDLIDRLEPEERVLLKFGRIEGGSVRNQIAAEARLEGSLRTFTTDMGERVRALIERVAEEQADELGCGHEITYSEGYPPVINDSALLDEASPAIDGLLEFGEPLLISEDFAFYQQRLPGVFLLLGTGTGIPLHSDTFDFDEAALARGLEVYERLIRLP